MNDTDLWLKHGRHTFLAPARADGDTLPLYRDIERGLEEMPDSKATFRLSEVLDEHDPGDVTQYTIGILTLLGSWRLNEVYRSNDHCHRYVNPAYPHKAHYTDVSARCGCGAVVFGVGWPTHDDSPRHNDECLYHWQLETAAEIWRHRRRVLRETLLLGFPGSAATTRLRCTGNHIGEMAERASIDLSATRQTGRRLRAETMWCLIQEHDPETVGALYGVSPETAKRYVRRYTDHDLLVAARRRTGRDIQIPT